MDLQNPENDNQLEQALAGLSEDEKMETLKKMGGVSYQRILLRAMDILSEEKKVLLENLMGQESFSQENLLEFLKNEIPNFDEIVEEETQRTSADFLALLKQ